jgi:hypothetical protein
MFGIASAAGVNNIAPDNLPLHLKFQHEKIEALREYSEKIGVQIVEDILEIIWLEILDFEFACETNDTEVLEIYMKEKYVKKYDNDHDYLFYEVCSKGLVLLVEWFVERYENLDVSTGFTSAAECGHLNVLKFLHTKNPSLGATVDVSSAAINGHLNVLQWAYENGIHCEMGKILRESAYNGHLEIAKWAYLSPIHISYIKEAINLASLSGHIDIVKWLCSLEGAYCTELAIDCAAGMGHYEVVKFLIENMNAKFTFSAIAWAQSEGHFAIVEYLCLGSDYLSVFSSLHFDEYVTKYLKNELMYTNPSGEGCEYHIEDGFEVTVREKIQDIAFFCMQM